MKQRRLHLLFLLLAVLMVPSAMQAKKIKKGNWLYTGEIPSGQGVFTCGETLTISGMFEGVTKDCRFSKVTNCSLTGIMQYEVKSTSDYSKTRQEKNIHFEGEIVAIPYKEGEWRKINQLKEGVLTIGHDTMNIKNVDAKLIFTEIEEFEKDKWANKKYSPKDYGLEFDFTDKGMIEPLFCYITTTNEIPYSSLKFGHIAGFSEMNGNETCEIKSIHGEKPEKSVIAHNLYIKKDITWGFVTTRQDDIFAVKYEYGSILTGKLDEFGKVSNIDEIICPNGDYFKGTYNNYSHPGGLAKYSLRATYTDGVITQEGMGGENTRIDYIDKNVFTGEICLTDESVGGENYIGISIPKFFAAKKISDLNLKYFSGTLVDPDGNLIVGYEKGLTFGEEAARKQKWLDEIQAAVDKIDKLEKEWSKKYGERWAKMAMRGQVAVGMPEDLIQRMNGIHRHESRGDVYIKPHVVHNQGEMWGYDWIYVSNGKVSYITTRYSYDANAW